MVFDSSDLDIIEKMKKGGFKPKRRYRRKTGFRKNPEAAVAWAMEKLGIGPVDVNPLFLYGLVLDEIRYLNGREKE